MWVLPQYEVRFTCLSGEESVTLKCAGYEEVTELVPILLRSGFGSFQVQHINEIGFPDLPVQFTVEDDVSNTGTEPRDG